MDQLFDLNCNYGVGVHLLSDASASLEYLESKRETVGKTCAPFLVLLRNHVDDVKNFPNRIERIAHLRDAQREHLGGYLHNMNADLQTSAVMLIDLDLAQIPSSQTLVEEFYSMSTTGHHDVLCAGGLMHSPYGYYDTFATVSLSMCFLFLFVKYLF